MSGRDSKAQHSAPRGVQVRPAPRRRTPRGLRGQVRGKLQAAEERSAETVRIDSMARDACSNPPFSHPWVPWSSHGHGTKTGGELHVTMEEVSGSGHC